MTLTTGQLLAERYRLGRRIAVGGMGEVWEAADTRLDRQVAVKVLKPELSGDDEFTVRFRAEARTTASLNHAGIASVHDYGETSLGAGEAPTAYLVMELVAGESLAAILARVHRLSPERTLDILEQAGNALQAAHQRGLVHRDIKPANILITPSGTVKLTDFGIAKAVDAAPVTRAGVVMGTAHYIAPEQAAGSDAGPASDVYSLGVVGYECLAGQRPFPSDNAVTVAMMHIRDVPPPLPPDVPNAVRSLIEATLVKDPRQRYATGGEFAAAVAALRAGRPLPIPVGMAGSAATALVAGDYPRTSVQAAYPQTALLPPGALTGQYGTGQYSAGQYGTGRYATGGYPAAPPPVPPAPYRRPERRRGGRGAGWILPVVLLLAALAVGAYLLREAFDSVTTPPVIAEEPTPSTEEPVPQEPETTTAETSPPETTPEEPPTDTAPMLEDIDYIGSSGTDAAARLADAGYTPRVVGFTDDELEGEALESCTVVDLDPDGAVEPGATVTVTCLGPPG